MLQGTAECTNVMVLVLSCIVLYCTYIYIYIVFYSTSSRPSFYLFYSVGPSKLKYCRNSDMHLDSFFKKPIGFIVDIHCLLF